MKETRTASEALGKVYIGPTEEERGSLVFRRTLYICNDLKKGEVLTSENLRAIRPGFGLAPKYQETLLNRRVNQNVSKGTPMKWVLVE